MTTTAQRLGQIAALGVALGMGRFNGGINWKQSGRPNLKARRAMRRHKNRIASRSRARNRA